MPGAHGVRAGKFLNLPLGNPAVLEALGPRGYVVNIARGSVIDQAA